MKPRDTPLTQTPPPTEATEAWDGLPGDLASPTSGAAAGDRDGAAPLGPVSRRGFLRGAAVGATAVLAACQQRPVKHALPYLIAPEEITPGLAVQYASTCGACNAACGLIITVRDGRPVKLEGRPDHPASRGGLCAFGQASIRGLYDPKRLRKPRIGGRDMGWTEFDAQLGKQLEQLKTSGKPLHAISHSLIRPTGRKLLEDFLKPHGGELFEYDPRSWSAALEARRLLDGEEALVDLDIGAAKVLVCLGADLLGAGLDPVTHTRSWAGGRGVQGTKKAANHHLQVEGSMSLTGASADERWAVTAAGQRLVALWLLRRVAQAGRSEEAQAIAAALGGLPPPVEGLRAAAGRLIINRGRSLVVSGADDLLEQVAVGLTNRLLGNEGKTVLVGRPAFQARGRDRRLLALKKELEQGKVGGVIVIDCDPVIEFPDGKGWGAQLSRLPLAVDISVRHTATSESCKFVAAAHHELERWDDFMPRKGLLSLAQPGVRPLFDSRHPWENLLRWGNSGTDFRLHLKKAWTRDVVPGVGPTGDAEGFWIEAVKRGGAAGEAALKWERPAAATSTRPAGHKLLRRLLGEAGKLAPSPNALEVELIAEVATRDGQQRHVPWLRELADPLTRVAWTPCARIAPARARALKLRDGGLVEIAVGGQKMTLQASVLPGQHPQVIGVPVGYGVRDAAKNGDANGFRLGSWSESGRRRMGLPATIKTAGEAAVVLPKVQWEGKTHHRPIVHQVATPQSAPPAGHAFSASTWPEREEHHPHWEMAIDLDRCTGCASCVVACQAENNIPVVGADEIRRHRDMAWIRVDRYFMGSEDDPQILFEPMMCAQCDRAPCETVCPVAATVHSEDGLNHQVYNRCVGTRYCANNCPYKVRRFNWLDYTVKDAVERLVLNPDVVARQRGVMEKCTFCIQRIQTARINGRHSPKKGAPQVRTACQQSCPADAIRFGDGADPASEVARWKKNPRSFQVLPELGIRPSVTYLARVRPARAASPKGGKHS